MGASGETLPTCFGEPAIIDSGTSARHRWGRGGSDVIRTGGGIGLRHGRSSLERPRRRDWARRNDPIDLGDGDDGASGDSLGANGAPGRGGNDLVLGGAGDDFLVGDSGIFDLGTIGGDGGNDVVIAGPENDILLGDHSPVEGSPTGESGNDVLLADDGHDDLVGDSRSDALVASGDGADSCGGGTGTDTATLCESITGVP
jgi:Ca2+-binding RTX toxin-like protein